MPARSILLRGVAVHNLKHIDLDIPRQKLVVICGKSGSGKTSLALDTLYAEGQRRYIDSFSAHERQFLEQLEKPAADRIEGIPPAIAVTHKNPSRSGRATVGTATEIVDYLRILYAKLAEITCLDCKHPVREDHPQSAATALQALPAGAKFVVGFVWSDEQRPPRLSELAAAMVERGFVRAIIDGRLLQLTDVGTAGASELKSTTQVIAVVDRLSAGDGNSRRLLDSLEAAFSAGLGQALALVPPNGDDLLPTSLLQRVAPPVTVDGLDWQRINFSSDLRCTYCGRGYPRLEPALFSFNSPLGACPACEGFGSVTDIDMDLVVPDPSKSLADAAITAWMTPKYEREHDAMLRAAQALHIPVDVPYESLSAEHRQLLFEGAPQHGYHGVRGFFASLERQKYKMHIRVFLARYRKYRPCPTCHGTRLRPEALAARLCGMNIAALLQLQVGAARRHLADLPLSENQRNVGRLLLEAATGRLSFLDQVGLGYLTLDRSLRTLSVGEAQRVTLTTALGSSLVNMLYVLDEPSVGLHPRDVDRLIGSIRALRDRGNSVVLVEHEEAMIRAADQVIEIGPGAGERGGTVVFQGTPDELLSAPSSLTGDYLSGRRGVGSNMRRRPAERGSVRLVGARAHNLQNLTVEFPLGLLCVVTGVSGAGKSTLVLETLYPAVAKGLGKPAEPPLEHDEVLGLGQLSDVILVDQSPIGRSPRSNPVTYIKAFDEIRNAFAETVDARTHNYDASYFSFNLEAGRCSTCEGDGYLEIDMQFLADVYMKCPQCHGARYRREILDVKYRGRSIAEVLDLTVREAFAFFRGQTKLQAKLKRLIDVGLDYLRLGQPANTLSGGEAQRLKLAEHMTSTRRGRSLFVLDEPTTGLHFADVVQLLDCFEALLNVGHSLLVVEHNLQLIKSADYLIDLGPGAAQDGGRIVATGTPEQVAADPSSVTGRYLVGVLAAQAAAQAP